MLVFGISFVVTDLIFVLATDQLFHYTNMVTGELGIPASPPPDGNKWFYLTLTNSMMVMIAYISFTVALKPSKYFLYLPILILSKFTSSITGLVFYFATTCRTPACLYEGGLDGAPYFSNLLVFITDFPLGVIALVLYLKGKRYYGK